MVQAPLSNFPCRTNGGDSAFVTITATGGGNYYCSRNGWYGPLNSGSGGGVGRYDSPGNTAGTGLVGRGNNGEPCLLYIILPGP